MTNVVTPPTRQRFVDNNGNPIPNGLVFTYQPASTTKIVTYQDQGTGNPNPNPVLLDYRSECDYWLPPGTVYKQVLAPPADTDPPSNPIWTRDNLTAPQVFALTQATIGAALNPQTLAEGAAGVTPVNYAIPSHATTGIINPERYGTNTTPGTTDMGPAWNSAISVSLATSGSGKLGCPIRWVGAHSIATPLSWGALGTNIVPVEVGGYGIASQLICNTTAGSGALFPMDTLNGWYLHDFLICGNSAHKNDGIHAGNVGSTLAIEWRVERVTSLMPGVGLKIQNTNTGSVESFRHWPGNNPALIVPQTVTFSDVSHGIYCTGNFVHNVSFSNIVCLPNSNYNTAMRGVKCDAASSLGCTFIMPLVQTGSGNNNETGIDWNPSGSTAALTLQGVYHEGTIISLGSVNQSTISSATDGGFGGAILVNPGSRGNKFIGCNIGVIDITDPSSWGNSFDSCLAHGPAAWSAVTPYLAGNYTSNGGNNYKCILANTNQSPPNATYWAAFSANAYNDATEGANLFAQPNRLISCALQGYSSGIPDLGGTWRKVLTISANVANPDVYAANWNVLRVQAATLTVNAPLHPRNGQRIGFTIRNETVGAITVTWTGFQSPPWTNPATTFNRSTEFMYDSDFSVWRQLWFSGADVPN